MIGFSLLILNIRKREDISSYVSVLEIQVLNDKNLVVILKSFIKLSIIK